MQAIAPVSLNQRIFDLCTDAPLKELARRWVQDRSLENLEPLRQRLDLTLGENSLLRYRPLSNALSNQVASRFFDLQFSLHQEAIIECAQRVAMRSFYPEWKHFCQIIIPKRLASFLNSSKVRTQVASTFVFFALTFVAWMEIWTNKIVDLYVISKIKNQNLLIILNVSDFVVKLFVIYNSIQICLLFFDFRDAAEKSGVFDNEALVENRLREFTIEWVDRIINQPPKYRIFVDPLVILCCEWFKHHTTVLSYLGSIRENLLNLAQRADDERRQICKQEACRAWLLSIGL